MANILSAAAAADLPATDPTNPTEAGTRSVSTSSSLGSSARLYALNLIRCGTSSPLLSLTGKQSANRASPSCVQKSLPAHDGSGLGCCRQDTGPRVPHPVNSTALL